MQSSQAQLSKSIEALTSILEESQSKGDPSLRELP
jgi:hypothetical protein